MLIIVLRCGRLVPIFLQPQQQLFETSIDQAPSQNGDVDMDDDDDTVPVVVKPGHIRFEPVGKGLMIYFYLRLSMHANRWEQYYTRLKRGWGSILRKLACYICLISYSYNMEHIIMSSLIALISLQLLRISLGNKSKTISLRYPCCSDILCCLLKFAIANYYCFVML